MGYVTYCTLCLVTDVKIYKMNSVMYTTYNELIKTQNKMSIDQMYACYECAHLLHKYKEFKEKCCNAYNLLQLYSDDFQITEENLKRIDRKQNNLKSKLTPYRDFLIYHIFEKKDKSNQKPNFHENVNINKLKIESSGNRLIGEDSNFNKRPLLYLENSENQQVNPLEIDEKNIKKEREDVVNNEESIVTSNSIEIEIDLHNKPLNEFGTGNNVGKLKIELEAENDNTENDSSCSNSSSEDNDSDEEYSNDVREEKSEAKIDSMIFLDSEDEDDKVIKDEYDIDKDNDELNELIEKYPPVDSKGSIIKNVDWEDKEITLLHKREPTTTKYEVTPKMLQTIEQMLKIKLPSNVNKCKTAKGLKRSASNKKRGSELDRSIFENYATIIEMTPEDAMREVLLRKETNNYKTCKYKCEYCFRGFNLETTYQTHMKKHSLEEGPLKCDICQIRFLHKRGVRNHMSRCHNYKFICLKCPYICFSSTQIRAHIFQHKGKQYSCNECGEKFRYPHSVLTHQRIKHKLEKVCDLCGNAYALEKGLISHKRRIHRNEQNEFQGPRCEECDVHFSNETAFKRHLVLCTKHKLSNGCEVCGETFYDRSGLREHSKQHERKRKYNSPYKRKVNDKVPGPCHYCGAPLETMREYNSHMSKYHPESEQAQIRVQMTNECVCEVCGMMFRLPRYLKAHQRMHTGEKPYACGKCDKRFALKHTLQTHEATHEGQAPYKCHICGKGYCNKSNLIKHIKYHTERRFQCPSCDKTFTYLYEMNNHVKYVHNKVPWPKRDRTQRDFVKKRQL